MPAPSVKHKKFDKSDGDGTIHGCSPSGGNFDKSDGDGTIHGCSPSDGKFEKWTGIANSGLRLRPA